MRGTRATLIGIAAAALAATAFAQTPPPGPDTSADPALVQSLTRDLTCTMAPQRLSATLGDRVKGATGPRDGIVAALQQIARQEDSCASIRSAASDLVDELLAEADAEATIANEKRTSGVVTSIVAEAFAEADRRAANPVFESGPPPRNLTRGRILTQ